jgi:hypothetical protein
MHAKRRMFTRPVGFLFLALICHSALSLTSSEPRPAVTATVYDASGSVLVDADVTVANASSANDVQKTQTDEQGQFSLPIVVGLQYVLTINENGFQTYSATFVGGQKLPAVQLSIAGNTEQVAVNALGASIDPQQTQTGTTLDEQQLATVPLNGRSFTDLLAITPGVVPVSSAQPNAVVMSGVASTPPSGDLDIGALSVSGQRETANSFHVNGANVQEDVNMGIAIVPTLDSVSELQVLTGSFDAKLGNQSGGQIAVTTRSGGDHFHGSVYDYFRNTALDARSYFSTTRAPFHQNQFGGTVGGPTRLKSLRFFADYQGTRETQGVESGVMAVPSLADRNGDLSDSLSSLAGRVSGSSWAQILTQRLGYTISDGEPYAAVFPNGQIPMSAWSAPAKALLQYIPKPNLSSNTFSTSSYAQTVRDDKGALRLDVGTRFGQFNVYGFSDGYSLLNPYPTAQGGASIPGFNARNQGRAQLYSANLTTSFGASIVNGVHISYMRNAATVGQPIGGQGVPLDSQGFVTGVGTSGIVPQMPAIEGVENIVFNDFTMGTTVTGLFQAENTLKIADDLSYAKGSHLFSLGVSGHADQINTHPNVYDNGSFSFTGSETGLDFADFLLGIDSTYTQGDGQNFYNRNHYLGFYAQDSWKVEPSLTLNYGLRWDLLPSWYEKYNQLLTLDPEEQSVVFPNAPKGILFPGDPGVSRTISPTRLQIFAPRVAASWSPTGHGLGATGTTLIHAGYGLYYSAFEGMSAGIMSGNPPYGFTDTTAAPTLFEEPFVEASTGTNLGQPFPLQHVAFGASPSHPNSSVDWSNYEPLTGIPAFAKDNVVPYTENYTLAVERQLGTHTVATISYVGTQAHHLLVIQEVNPGNPALCLSLSQRSELAPGSAACGPFNESSTFTAANGMVYNGTRSTFSSAFGSVNLQRTIANSHDNALEAQFKHTMHNLYLQVAYTWSKSIDQSSSLAEAVYPGNAGLSRAISAFDMRHNLSATYRYEVPLTRFAPNNPRLTEGWQISGLTRLGTGLPVTLVNNNDTSLLGSAPNGINNNGVDEPEYTSGDLRIQHHPGSSAFNTSLFSLPALGTLGNARRRFFYGPGPDNTDIAVSKRTILHDQVSLEVRVEAFNVFNHSQFFGPAAINGNISSANFGQIENASSPRLMQIAARLHF